MRRIYSRASFGSPGRLVRVNTPDRAARVVARYASASV
jgi:hypothetical protein